MGTLYENIISLCTEKGIKGGKMCVDLGISKSLMTKLRDNPARQITSDTAQKIADYFGVSVERVLTGAEKERPAEGETLGKDEIQAFQDAALALQEAVKKLESGEAKATVDAEEIKITCPIDHTEQVIVQPYACINGQRYAQQNNGCENARDCEECQLCMMRAMLRVMKD